MSFLRGESSRISFRNVATSNIYLPVATGQRHLGLAVTKSFFDTG